MGEINLTGIAADDPRSRVARQFLFAQGTATGASNGRPILLIGNKTSAGTEIVETIGQPIQNLGDCWARFGRRSELTRMYATAISVAPNATYYGVAMAEAGGASASQITWSFQTTADQVGTVQLAWGGRVLQYVVQSGDLPTATATGVAAKINADPDFPFTAAVGTGSTTIAAGSDSQALPQASISVASTTGFPTSGVVFIGTLNTYVAYTGVSGGNTLTGCTGGTGTMHTGYTVTNASQVQITAANLGPRGDYITNRLRLSFLAANAQTVTKGPLISGQGADSVANALAAVAQRTDLYYIAPACTANATVTASDGGVGQAISWAQTQASASVGQDLQIMFGLDCSQSQATSVATSSAANWPRAMFLHVQNNDYSPPMVAAVNAAIKWVKETQYPASSFRGFTTDGTYNFPIPPPFASTDRFSATQIIADLNNGVTPVDFGPGGGARLSRHITSYNLVPGTSNKDYRARESHIPSVEDAAWEYVAGRWETIRQEGVTGDVPAGARPLKGFTTSSQMRTLMYSAIDVLSGNQSPWGKAILDPEAVADMKNSVYIEERANGFGVAVNWQPARHDLQDDFLISQGGAGY